MCKKIIIAIIHLYQKGISPFSPASCRFYPTCSQYAIEAINRYGITKGIFRATLRVLKCNPLHPGGYDPV
ncbi:MAG: membrane protein insertion efficiency factor YidD [Thermodesulfobacteriota bacterium]|nr:membrane protein insertion efficiency factor YidD [Thermodesulfobacteriota bacterium]